MFGFNAVFLGRSAPLNVRYNFSSTDTYSDKKRYFDNIASASTAYHGIINSGNAVGLNESGDSGQSVTLNIEDTFDYSYYDVNNQNQVKVTATSTTVSINISFNNFFVTDTTISTNDLDLINLEPSLILRLYFGDTTTGLSFNSSNIKHIYSGNSGGLGGNVVHDLVTDTNFAITGATANTWNTFKDIDYGLQNLLLVMNSSGEVTGYRNENTVDFINKTGYVDTNIIPNQSAFSVAQVIKGNLQNFETNWASVTGVNKVLSGAGNSITEDASGEYTVVMAVDSVDGSTEPFIQPQFVSDADEYEVIFRVDVTSGTIVFRNITGGSAQYPADGSGIAITDSYELTFTDNPRTQYNFSANFLGQDVRNVYPCNFTVQFTIRKLNTPTERFEHRVLTSEPKYFINEDLQDTLPISLDTTSSIKLEKETKIGFSDTIDVIECLFEFVDREYQETDVKYSFENYLSCSGLSLKDENGNDLVDENNVMLNIINY